jgi:hypothetical protein
MNMQKVKEEIMHIISQPNDFLFTAKYLREYFQESIAELEAEKPEEDATCVLCECEFYDSKYPQNCSGELGGEPAIAQCTKYANNSRIFQKYAESYHKQKCEECNNKSLR